MYNKLKIQGTFVGSYFLWLNKFVTLRCPTQLWARERGEKKKKRSVFLPQECLLISWKPTDADTDRWCAGVPSPPRCYFCESANQHLSSDICQPGRLRIFGTFSGRNYSTENNSYSTNDAVGGGGEDCRKLRKYRNSRKKGEAQLVKHFPTEKMWHALSRCLSLTALFAKGSN